MICDGLAKDFGEVDVVGDGSAGNMNSSNISDGNGGGMSCLADTAASCAGPECCAPRNAANKKR
jgi:hypothetical protein